MDHLEFEKFYKGLCQFDGYLGMALQVHAPGKITYTLEVKAHHLTFPDACHGGVVAAMMDAVLGVTCLSWTLTQGNSCNTVEFKTNYLSGARPGDLLEGTGQIDFIGSTLMVASAHIHDKTSGRLVAKGLGTFSQYPITKKADALADSGLEIL